MDPNLDTLAKNWAFALETAVPKNASPEQVRMLKRFFYLGASSVAHMHTAAKTAASYQGGADAPEQVWQTVHDELREYQQAVLGGKE